jgi:hypothetical protein
MKPRDANDILREGGSDGLRATFDRAKRGKPMQAANKVAGPDIYTADSLRLQQFPPLKRICGDIVVEGLTLLAARPKIGKTWLALDIAIAVAQGSYCLGDIQCESGDVLFLALEDNKRRMQRRLTKLLGVNKTPWPKFFSCAHNWLRSDQGGLDHIRDWIAKVQNPRLVVIDVLARFRKRVGSSKQSYEADYEAIAELQKIASDTGVAIVVIHHTRKGEADDPIDAVSGTLGLAGASDAVLVIDRNPQGVRLYGRSRDVDEIDKAMSFDRETCRWTILGETCDVRRTDERKRIIAVLKEEGEPMTPKNIAEAVSQRATNVRRLLRKMAKAGEVTKIKYGLYALPDTPATPGTTGLSGLSYRWQERPRDQ